MGGGDRHACGAVAGNKQRQDQARATNTRARPSTPELRVNKKKVEFRNGDEVVAAHDKQSKKWDYKGKEFNVTSEDNANIKPGKNTNITSPTVGINGADGVGITGPTTVNGNPVATTDMFIARDAVILALEAAHRCTGSEACGHEHRRRRSLFCSNSISRLRGATRLAAERSKSDRRMALICNRQ